MQQVENTVTVKRIPVLNELELKEVKGSHHVYSKHSHEEYSLCLMHEGLAGVEYGGNRYLAGKRSITIMNPGEVHACWAESENISFSMLYPTGIAWDTALEDIFEQSVSPYFKEPIIEDKTLMALMRRFLDHVAEPLANEGHYLELLTHLMSCYSDTRLTIRPVGKEQKAVHIAREYLEENYKEAISLDELAKICNLNASYLNRVFKKALGLPPHAYQINVRLLKAKVLLQEGQTISDTALKLGFSDQSHFTRLFKRSFGMTPGQYQKVKIVQDIN